VYDGQQGTLVPDQPHSTVIVCAAGSGVSYGLIHRLRITWGSKVHIVALDINPAHLVSASVLADEFIQVAPSTDIRFQKQLSSVLYRHTNSHIYPVVNSDFYALAELRRSGTFKECDFVCPDDRYLSLATDKLFLDRTMQSIGIPTPETFTAEDIERKYVPECLFIKPRNGFGSLGARGITRNAILAMRENELQNFIVQEVCSGPEVTIDAFVDAKLGHCVVTCRERIEIKSGVCTKARLFANTELEDLARRIGFALEIRGSFCFQVMRAKDKWVVTDLNLRPGAGTALSCAIGADFFSAMHACRCGERGIDLIDLSLIEHGDCFVTRQYVEYVTSLPR